MKKRKEQHPSIADDTESGHEAEAMLVLAEWINCQGDSGETEALMDRAELEIPDKIDHGSRKL